MRSLVRELGLRLEDRESRGQTSGPGRARGSTSTAPSGSEDDVFRGYGDLQAAARAPTRRQDGYFSDGYANRAAQHYDAETVDRWLRRKTFPAARPSLLDEGDARLHGQRVRRRPAAGSAPPTSSTSSRPTDALRPRATGLTSASTFTGGNDQVPRRIAGRLPHGSLTLDAPLEALRRRGDGTYAMSFGGVSGEVGARRVVLAAPFTTLRDVDLEHAGLSPIKREAIERFGIGTNAKLLMQFRHRPSHFGGWNGGSRAPTDRPSSTPGTAH